MSFEPPTPPYNASDPHATFLNSSCFDFLLIEVVPLAYRTAAAVTTAPPPRVTLKSLSSAGTNTAAPTAGLAVGGDGRGGGAEAQAQAQAQGQGKKVSSKQKPTSLGVGNATNTTAPGGGLAIGGSAGASIGASAGTTAAGNNNNNNNNTASAAATTEDDAQREIVSKRLEALGYRVGQGLVERFSRDRPRFTDALDVIKFLCKDLWTLLFRKQIDNLKTNHRGVYVLTDNTFRPFSRMSMKTSAEALERAQPFLWFPCGIIRGALASLGIQAVVQAESMELPTAVFQIKTVAANKG